MVALTFRDEEFNALLPSNRFDPFVESLRLLDGHYLVGTSVNDEKRRHILTYIRDGGA